MKVAIVWALSGMALAETLNGHTGPQVLLMERDAFDRKSAVLKKYRGKIQDLRREELLHHLDAQGLPSTLSALVADYLTHLDDVKDVFEQLGVPGMATN